MDDKSERLLQHFIEKINEADSSTLDSLEEALADVPLPREPVWDYVDNFETRRALFLYWQQSLEGMAQNAATFAFFMIAPIEEIKQLRPLVLDVLANPDPDPDSFEFKRACRMRLDVTHGAYRAIRAYKREKHIIYEREKYKPANQLDKAAKDADARDDHKCIFTGTPNPSATHIFPHSLSQNTDRGVLFSSVLSTFWGSAQVAEWMTLLRQIGSTAQNRIPLDLQLRYDLDIKDTWALKPLDHSETWVKVQWHWLKKSALHPSTIITDIDDAISKAGLNDPGWGHQLAHRSSGLRLRTGQVFYFRSDDPQKLPSYKFLEAHWNPTRVAAICGAANSSQ